MQDAVAMREPVEEYSKVREMYLGANWFLWVSILSVINTLVVYFSGLGNLLIGLGATQYVDSALVANSGTQRIAGLAINFAIAGLFAAFGYFARKGLDIAFILGMFLYVFDSVIALGFREFFGFGFHLLALFFIFKGLLASRRRYDPSAE